MPKCPNCKKTINSLDEEEQNWVRYSGAILSKEVEDGLDFPNAGVVSDTADPDGDYQHYYCPECDEEVVSSYKKAVAFLQGKKAD